MASKKNLLCLDVGEKRIGVAVADTAVRIAIPFTTIEVGDERETTIKEIAEIIVRERVDETVVGYPRNQQGEDTAQTAYVQEFAANLDEFTKVVFQYESLTSVIAEQRLNKRGKPYSKGDIDAEAASIILQDYLEQNYAR